MAGQRSVSWLVPALFFCSGATALVYEIVWARLLAQMFGSTIQAQTVVLAVFMGGLALGNRWVGALADRWSRPLRIYGFLELAIAVYAFAFPWLYEWADRLFVLGGAGLLDRSGWLLGLKGALSVALLLLPTVMMGGTLPLVAAWLHARSTEAGRGTATFYAVNSLGAVCGAWLAGFFLVRSWGVVATLQATALINALVGAAALLVGAQPARRPADEVRAEVPHCSTETPVAWMAVIVATTGAVSMGLEVLASRMLVLIFGSSLQSFAVVLITFILGIGLGALAVSSRRLTRWRAETLITFSLLGAAVWLAAWLFKVEWGVDWYRRIQAGLAHNETGYLYHQWVKVGTALVLLGVPAALIGGALPLMLRSLSGGAVGLARHVGRLLTWNTLGAMGGTLLAGFVLMPTLGLRGAFGLMAMVLCLAAFAVAWRWRVAGGTSCAGLAALGCAALFTLGGQQWNEVMSSGVFRKKDDGSMADLLEQRRKSARILFYEDAPDATVTIEQWQRDGKAPDLGLRINGKADASSRGDLATQLLLGHLPMLAHPEARQVFVLGLGSGVTGGALAAHPVERITIAENCEPVVRAARFFDPWSRGVLTNPLVRLCREDARTVLKLSPQRYDVLITEPSNPWTAGVGSVFSREFYELAATRLTERGVMAQWFHLYEMSDAIVAMVLRTFGSVFPHLEVWDSSTGDIIILGSMHPWPATPESYAKVLAREVPARDLRAIGIDSADALFLRQIASQRTAAALAGDGPVQRDWFPVLEYEAPRAFYVGVTSRLLDRFDERTWQSRLAPAEKIAALHRLGESDLRRVFSDYGPVNQDLLQQLRWRTRSPQLTLSDVPPSLFEIPGVLRPAAFAPPRKTIPDDASEEIRRLMQADDWIEHEPARTRAGVETIEALLGGRTEKSDWSVSHYAARAARAALALGDGAGAGRILEMALKSAPAHAELNYLWRVAKRELSATPSARASRAAGAAAEF